MVAPFRERVLAGFSEVHAGGCFPGGGGGGDFGIAKESGGGRNDLPSCDRCRLYLPGPGAGVPAGGGCRPGHLLVFGQGSCFPLRLHMVSRDVSALSLRPAYEPRLARDDPPRVGQRDCNRGRLLLAETEPGGDGDWFPGPVMEPT